MAKVTKPSAPDHLTMKLFAPGMTALHRAGLGGLACTLNAMERQHEAGLLKADKLPAAMTGGEYPWSVTDDTVTLKFGKPENAGEYLKKLFAFAFQVKEGLIHLPGQYGGIPPTLVIQAAIQDGIQNTFLQHGPTCGSRDGERTVTVEVNDTPVSVTHDVFTSYKHQGWFWLDRDEKSKEKDPTTGKKVKTGNRVKNHQSFAVVGEDGTLSGELHEIDNKISPGGMVRHDRFKQSSIRETDAGLICLHFALVGCLTLSINRVTAVLVVPEVERLTDFIYVRESLTPRTAQDCRIACASDAALQAQIRVRARADAAVADLPACQVMTCKPTKWNEKQKPRVAAARVSVLADAVLDRFERALAQLPPRLVVPKPQEPTGRRKTKPKLKQPFWADSVVRPMIAENLATGRPWFAGFTRLMTSTDPSTKTPYREQLPFERRGLHAMISDPKMWDQDGEAGHRLVVHAVHEAIRSSLGRIKKNTDGENDSPPSEETKKRWKRFRERLRLDLCGAKTPAHVRFALTNLFSRSEYNPALQKEWPKVLPVLQRDWQLARDLGLLALASYSGRGADDTTATEPTEPTEEK